MESSFSQDINLENIPNHVAIIMDGNGRWAENHGEMRTYGHINGVPSVREALEAAAELKVNYLTLYAFSTENWNRPKDEVNALMELLVNTIVEETDKLHKNNVRLLAIGALETMPESCQNTLNQAIAKTKNNDGTTLVLALSYSGKWDVKQAVKKIANKVSTGEIDVDDISDEMIDRNLRTAGIPDPELLIRTSGEKRISNFLLWQIAYAELYFTDILWPDFKKEDFYDAIRSYQCRDRRFGRVKDKKVPIG